MNKSVHNIAYRSRLQYFFVHLSFERRSQFYEAVDWNLLIFSGKKRSQSTVKKSRKERDKEKARNKSHHKKSESDGKSQFISFKLCLKAIFMVLFR